MTIADNKAKQTLEVGAGCGEFGYKYLQPCYITEYDTWYEKNCQKHYVDFFQIDANNLYLWSENRFQHVVMCNPFGYGFCDKTSTEKLLKELVRVLKPNGKITVIANSTNKYGAPKRIKTSIDKADLPPNVSIAIDSNTMLDPKYGDHVFRQLHLETEIKPPLYQTTIYVSKL